MEGAAVRDRWKEYAEGLYRRDPMISEVFEDAYHFVDLEPSILESEVRQAVKILSSNKAPGIDNIPIELFKKAGEQGIKVMHRLLNEIWVSRVWPKQWQRSVYIPIYKKGDPSECSNYRTISLIPHASKIMLKIIQKRLEPIMESLIPPEQAGFRKNRGTRDHISNIRRLMEKAREHQKDLFMCFIDYSKAFDCVDHGSLWRVLLEMGVPLHLVLLMRQLYTEQEAAVRTEDGDSEWFKVKKGVRQGCILSPYLFNLFAEYIMRKANLEDCCKGVRIGGMSLTNIRYADDTTLLAESSLDLTKAIKRVKEESERMGLYLNMKKTKIMTTSETPVKICFGDEEVELVDSFVYLGSLVTCKGMCDAEVKRRIALGRKAMNALGPIVQDKLTDVKLKVRLVKAMVFPVVLYGSESWTLRKAEEKRLEAFEMWCWRRILRLSWMMKVTNEAVLTCVQPGTSLLGLVYKQQLSYFGHMMRGEGLEKMIITGHVEGKRRRGRQRARWLDGVAKVSGRSWQNLKEMVWDRTEWRRQTHRVTRGRIRPGGT